jgi:hypothetical protein
MNAETPTPGLIGCQGFIRFWMDVTGAPRVMLTAIIPDGPTAIHTFTGAGQDMATWIAARRQAGRG